MCDYLCCNVVMNELVRDNVGCCLDFVKDVLKLIDCKSYYNFFVRLRKCLEIVVIVCCFEEYILGFFFCENKFCRIGENLFFR